MWCTLLLLLMLQLSFVNCCTVAPTALTLQSTPIIITGSGDGGDLEAWLVGGDSDDGDDACKYLRILS